MSSLISDLREEHPMGGKSSPCSQNMIYANIDEMGPCLVTFLHFSIESSCRNPGLVSPFLQLVNSGEAHQRFQKGPLCFQLDSSISMHSEY